MLFDGILDLIGQYLLLIFISIVVGFALVMFILRNFNSKSPILEFIISKFGLYFLDTSDLSVEFGSGVNLLSGDLYSKNLILISGNINLNTEELKSSKSIGNNKISWEVFNKAAVLKVDPKVFMSDEFSMVKKLLNCYRTSKPINAFILTLSIDDLSCPLRVDSILERFLRFDVFQYPTYLVIEEEKSKSLFAKLKATLSPKEKNMVIGWSDDPNSHFDVEKYSPPNIDSTTSSIVSHICSKLQQIVDTKASALEDSSLSDLVLLPEKIEKLLKDNLKRFISKIFASKEHFFLRGVYFSSDEAFVSDLFFKSIFIEDLSSSVYKGKQNFYSLTIRRSLMIFSIIGIAYVPFAHRTVLSKCEKVQFAIEKIQYLLRRERISTEKTLIDFAQSLQETEGSVPHFFPWSSILRVKNKVNRVLAIMYNRLVLNKIFKTFNEDVTSISQGKSTNAEVPGVSRSLFKAREFSDLVQYANSVACMEDVENDIVNISRSSGTMNLGDAIKKLFKCDVPKSLQKYRRVYDAAFQYPLVEASKTMNYKNDFKVNFTQKADRFCSVVSNPEFIFDSIKALTDNLQSGIDQLKNYSIADLIKLKDTIDSILKAHLSFKFLFENQKLSDMESLLKTLDRCLVFDEDFISEFKDKIRQTIENLKQKLLLVNLPIFTRIFESSDDLVKISSSIQNTLVILQNFFSKSLVNPSERRVNLEDRLPIATSLEWNPQKLSIVLSKINEFQSFTSESLAIISMDIRLYLSSIIGEIFAKSVENQLSACLDQRRNSYSQEELDVAVDNMVKSISILLQIVDFLKKQSQIELVQKVHKILVAQVSLILGDLYSKVDGIYSLSIEQVAQDGVTDKYVSSYLASNKKKLLEAYNKAKPFIDYARILQNSCGFEVDFLKRWSSIEEFLDESNGIMHKLDTCLAKVMIGEVEDVQSTNDFLTIRKERALDALSIKLQKISLEEIKTIYPLLQNEFNASLANYFPFGSTNCADVPIEKVGSFVTFWDKNERSIKRILNSFKDNPKTSSSVASSSGAIPDSAVAAPNNSKWYKFLKNMSLAVQWLHHIADPDKYPASIQIFPRSRPNVEQNSSDLIALRVMCAGGNQLCRIQRSFPVARMEINSALKADYLGYSSIDLAIQIASESSLQFANPEYTKFAGASYRGLFAIIRFISDNFTDIDESGSVWMEVRRGTIPASVGAAPLPAISSLGLPSSISSSLPTPQSLTSNGASVSQPPATPSATDVVVSMNATIHGLTYTQFPYTCPDLDV